MDNWGPAVMWEHAELGWGGVGGQCGEATEVRGSCG